MARPKKELPNRADNLHEVKVKIGETFEGVAIRKSFYSPISKADARLKGEEYKIRNAVAEQTGTPMQNKTSFKDWASKWLEVYKKPNVAENTYMYNYKNAIDNHILPYFGKSSLQNIKPIDIQNFYSTKRNLSRSALEKIAICLNGIFETAIDNDLIFKNPTRNVNFVSDREKNVKNVYTTDEIKIAKDFFKNKMPEVFLILCSGLRRGELLGLKWSDIDFKEEKLSVNRAISSKNGGGVVVRPPKWNSYRDIPIEADLLELLKTLPQNNEYVFPNVDGVGCQLPCAWSNKLRRYMKKANEKLNIPKLSAHEIRHTYGTELRRRGVDIYTIQKIMGHKDITMTTEIYVHNEFEVLKKAVLNK